MTCTIMKEFKKLIEMCPKETLKNVWFFPIRQDKKIPDVKSGTILKENLSCKLTIGDVIKRLKSGKNYGIYALDKGLMFLDLDVSKGKLLASNEFVSKIPETFQVKTRNGGIQYYYINEGIFPNQLIYEGDIKIGELRTDWYYVVGCGSYVTPDENSIGDDGTYRVIEKRPISQFWDFTGNLKKTEEIRSKKISPFEQKELFQIKTGDYSKKIENKKKEKLSIEELRCMAILRRLEQ